MSQESAQEIKLRLIKETRIGQALWFVWGTKQKGKTKESDSVVLVRSTQHTLKHSKHSHLIFAFYPLIGTQTP